MQARPYESSYSIGSPAATTPNVRRPGHREHATLVGHDLERRPDRIATRRGTDLVHQRGQLEVAERVLVDHLGRQAALDGRRRRDRRRDELVGDRGAQRLERGAAREVRGGGREHVAAVEGAGDERQAVGGVLEEARLDDAAQALGRGHEQPVVGPDEHVAARDPQGDRPACRAHARVDHRHVEPERRVRERAPQREGAVADRVLADLVRQVDDLGVGADVEDDGAADRRGHVAQPEVGEQRDDGTAGHGVGW